MEGGIPEAAPRVPPSTSPLSACTESSARKRAARRAGDCCRQTAATTWAPPRRLRSILLPRPNPISLLTGYGQAEQSSFTLGCFFFWLYLVMFSGQTPGPHPIKEPLASTGPWLGTRLCSQTKQHPQGLLGCTPGWGGPWGAGQVVSTCCGFSVRFWAPLVRSVTAAGMRGHGTSGAHQVPVELTRSQWLELHAAHSHHQITSPPWPPPHTHHPCSHANLSLSRSNQKEGTGTELCQRFAQFRGMEEGKGRFMGLGHRPGGSQTPQGLEGQHGDSRHSRWEWENVNTPVMHL